MIEWLDSAASRVALGWPATVRWWEETLETCHHDNIPRVMQQLQDARRGAGTTLFDWLVELIEEHGPGGPESDDNVHLVLL